MKYILMILICLFASNSFSDGGDDSYVRRDQIEYYEPNLNLQYKGINDTLRWVDNRNKNRKKHIISNVAVYDITKNKINYIFSDTIQRTIIGFHFESSYLKDYKSIEFNNAYNPNNSYGEGIYSFSNNKNVEDRPLSNNIILLTKDKEDKIFTVWICDKYGNDVKKALEFNDSWGYEIDVKNQMFRISRQVNSRIEIKNVKY